MSEKLNRNDQNCDIVADLLPLYHDGVVSDSTKAFVEDHLRECEHCRAEFEALSSALPIPMTKTPYTKNQFVKAIKSNTVKNVLKCATTLTIVFALVLGFIFLGQTVPIKNLPDNDIQLHKVFRYEVDGEYKFFVFCSNTGYHHGTKESVSRNKQSGDITINIKTPLLSQIMEGADYERDPIIIEDIENCKKLYFGNTLIWTEEENGDDVVPEYVYAHDSIPTEPFERAGHGWGISYAENYAMRQYGETGRMIIWDLEGNVLYDGYHDERNSYPNIPDIIPRSLRDLFS